MNTEATIPQTCRSLSHVAGFNTAEAVALCKAADRIETLERIVADLAAMTPSSLGYNVNALLAPLDDLQARAKAAMVEGA